MYELTVLLQGNWAAYSRAWTRKCFKCNKNEDNSKNVLETNKAKYNHKDWPKKLKHKQNSRKNI